MRNEKRGSKNESGKRLISEETASLPSVTEVESSESRCQMFSLFGVSCDFLLSAYMVSHFSAPQIARRHFSIFSSMLSPCLASVCETSLRSRTVRPPSFPLRIILLHQPNFYSVTLCVQVAAVFLLHWEKYYHSFLQFTQLITNPKYFLWKSLRERRMNNIVPVNPLSDWFV